MKVTAILPDDLIKQVKSFSHAKNITESLKIALNEWISIQKIKSLNDDISSKPLKMNQKSFTKIREINRK